VNIFGTDYYQFNLNLNESNGGTSEQIQLTAMKFYSSDHQASSADYTGSGLDPTHGFSLAYNLDGGSGGDTQLLLMDHTSGIGSSDYTFWVPTSDFATNTGYLTLYAQFTNADAGFEQFSALTKLADGPSLAIFKDTI